LCTTLQRTSEHREQRSDLDVALASKSGGRPHNEQGPDGTATTEHAVGGCDGMRGSSAIARLALKREIEELIPARLADSAAYD
tara:strand:+ start:16170 stop:16418 length:249 start_codon:yes stop_codon:yes gene_type:complete